MLEKRSEVNAIGELIDLVLNEETKEAAPSRANMVPSPGVEDADLVASRAPNQKMQAENEELVARCAGNQNSQMDTLLKL